MAIISDSARNNRYYVTLSTQVIRAVRGGYSQGYISKKLGHSYNLVSKWEIGSTRIRWSEFEKLTAVRKMNLPKAVERIFLSKSSGSPSDFIETLKGALSLQEWSQNVKLPQKTLKRWLTPGSDPYVADMLLLIDRSSKFLIRFVEALVAIEQVELLFDRYLLQRRLDDFVGRYPQAVAMLCLMETPLFRSLQADHVEYFHRSLGLPHRDVCVILEELIEIGLVKRSGKKLNLVLDCEVDITMDFATVRRMNRYWTDVLTSAFDRMDRGSPGFKAGNLVFCTTDAGYEKIKLKMVEFFNYVRMHHVGKSDGNRVGVVVMYLADLIACGSVTRPSDAKRKAE